jgi:hypothetical protein
MADNRPDWMGDNLPKWLTDRDSFVLDEVPEKIISLLLKNLYREFQQLRDYYNSEPRRISMESFLIIDTIASKEIRLNVASAILKAQEIREQSWNIKTEKYELTTKEAVKKAVPIFIQGEVWETIITGWLYHMWNESEEWAKGVIYEFGIDDVLV